MSIEALIKSIPDTKASTEINGILVEFEPLSVTKIAKVLRRYPQVLDLFEGKLFVGKTADILKSAISFGPEAISAIIASATGFADNIEAEKKIASMPDEWKIQLLIAICQETAPEGMQAFLEKLLAPLQELGVSMTDEVAEEAAETEEAA